MLLRCRDCEKEHPDDFILRCECGGILEIRNEFHSSFEDLLNTKNTDVSRYLNFLPIKKEYVPDLTPSITPNIEKGVDDRSVVFKSEYLMPSGSFKDRGTYTTIAKLKEEGIKEVSLDSSGNAAISLALYARAEGIKSNIFVPDNISRTKERMLNMLNVELHRISGNRMDVHERALNFDKGRYVSHWYNPFFTEGTKIAAYEVAEQMDVHHVLVPTGSGTLFFGLYHGFEELKRLGVVKNIPKMIAVEARGFETLKDRSSKKSKLAKGIEIPEPPRKDQMKAILKDTDGFSVSVDDEAIKHAKSGLAEMGFLVEPTSAAAYAAFNELNSEEFKKGEKVLIPLTGSSFKSF